MTRGWGGLAPLLALAVVLAGLAGLAGCGGNSEGDQASVRLVNASTGYASVELLVDDVRRGEAVAQGLAGGYTRVSAEDAVTTAVGVAGTGATLVRSEGGRFVKDTAYTLVLHGYPGSPKTKLLTENQSAAASGRARLVVENLGTDAGALDVYLTGSADEPLDSAVPVLTAVAGGATSAATTVAAGTYRLRVTAAGERSDLRLDVPGLVLGSTQVATLLLTPATGGVLVNGQLLVQQGASTLLANRHARARVVAALANHARVSANVGGTVVASALASPNVGAYALVPAGDALAWTLSVDGVAVTVPSLSLPAGSDGTLLVWGAAGSPRHSLISDDSRWPADASRAKLRLVNGLAGSDGGLSLSADLSPRASNIGAGAASAYSLVASSSAMRLEVSSPLVGTPLYSNTEARIDAKGLYSVFMLGDLTAPSPLLVRER